MLKLKFFASLREALGSADESLALSADIATLGDLRVHLAARGGEWSRLTASRSLRCAVNQEMARDEVRLADGDEVAFFPPVTGG